MRSVLLGLGLCMVASVGRAIDIELDGAQLPDGAFTLFAAPGELLVLTLPAGTDNTQLYLDGVGAGQRKAGRWTLRAPAEPGRYALQINDQVSLARRPLTLLVGRPALDIKGERLGDYRIGPSPAAHPHPDYAKYYDPPLAFFEVAEADASLAVSEHFMLGQFLCKQASDFPKYLVLQSSLLILLEGIVEELNARGYAVTTLGVISGYRTPYYNRRIGNVPNSRHVFGDAFDFYVDVDRDGRMDDLDGDGKRDKGDVDHLYAIVTALKQRPEFSGLVGGVGRYYPNDRHGGFIHVDTRGFKARW